MKPGTGADELQQALDAAIRVDDGSPSRRRARLDLVRQMIVALVDDLNDAAADDLIASIGPLTRHDPRLEIEMRRELAFELASLRDHERAVAQLYAALDRARDLGLDREELDLGVDLASLFRGSSRNLDAAAVLANTKERVESRREHARVVERAEELFDLGLFGQARALLEQLPPTDDDRESRALLDDLRRRQGEHVSEPTDAPDGAEPSLDPRVRTFVTRPSSLPQGVLDGGLLGTERILELSNGAIEDPADLDSEVVFGPRRSFRCACGRYRGRHYANIVCRRCRVEVIAASSRRVRCGHVELAARVVHPWYEAAAAQLLDRPLAEAQDIGAERLAAELAAVDVGKLAAELRRTISTATSSKLANQAGRRLALVDAFALARTTHLVTPQSIVLTVLLVVPPDARLCSSDDVRDAYREIVAATSEQQTRTAVQALFAAFEDTRR